MAHEQGHYALQTTSELLADKYAFDMYKGPGDGVTFGDMMNSLKQILPFSKQEDFERVAAQQRRIDNYLNKHNNMSTSSYAGGYLDEQTYSNGFLGIAIGKKARERKQEKHEAKIAKKDSKTQLRLAKAQAKVTKADAKLAATQGTTQVVTDNTDTGEKKAFPTKAIIISVVVVIVLAVVSFILLKK